MRLNLNLSVKNQFTPCVLLSDNKGEQVLDSVYGYGYGSLYLLFGCIWCFECLIHGCYFCLHIFFI